MKNIELLDCTLRDGGYINNWEFGEDNIRNVISKMLTSETEIVEIGFLRDEPYNVNRAVWNDVREAGNFFPQERKAFISLMGEIFNPYPLDKIPDYFEGGVDILRIICWKKLEKEALGYCRSLVNKGYKVCIQPDRVNQYSIDEFKVLCEKYSKINPYAIYVVDSNGFLSQKEIMSYLIAADSVLPESVRLGYHGHNSILQAEGSAELFVDAGFKRDIIIDGSVFGIGRASGNLNIEIFAKYLNENYEKNYDISCFLNIFEFCIKDLYEKNRWGYSMESYLSSLYRCNPNYATILKNDYNFSPGEIEEGIKMLSDVDKVITNKAIIPEIVKKIKS